MPGRQSLLFLFRLIHSDRISETMIQKSENLPRIQKIVVFQQNGRGENKIQGIKKYGKGLFDLEITSIESGLPPLLDHTNPYLPEMIKADLVLDFLIHPDLSHDLALICQRKNIPVIASGKKILVQGIITPPT